MPFSIERNDLATVEADAVVVAANEHLKITGGVGMAVARAAGLAELQAACDEIGFCPCGSAVATPAFNLKASVVVHAVGPVWMGGARGEADFLRSAYDAALECAVAEGARSIALPLISSGTYGFPPDVSLAVARESIRVFLNRHDDIDVRLVLYDRESVMAGMAAYLDIAEYIDDRCVDESHGRKIAGSNMPAAPDLEPRGTQKRRHLFPQRSSEAKGTFAKRDRADHVPFDADAYIAFAEESIAHDAAPMAAPGMAAAPARGRSLEDLLNSMDAPFSTTLLALIDERGMTDAQVYKRANMSRQLFSKIRSDADYRPSKKTVLALAIALGLNLGETEDLLARAGFALSNSSKSDIIVEYFISRGNYDIFEINEALYAFDQPIL